MYEIKEITENHQKVNYGEQILRTLPEWFGIEESLLDYVNSLPKYPFFAAFKNQKCIGFFSGKIHHGRTGEIYVCGIDPKHQGVGVGTALYQILEAYCKDKGCGEMAVLTLDEAHPDKNYAMTRKFYQSLGFEAFYTSTEIWGEDHPCLIMKKEIGGKK